jgi:hypothetical protein
MEEPQRLTLNLSIEEVNLLLAALGEQPAKVSMGLIVEIQKQCQQRESTSEEVERND